MARGFEPAPRALQRWATNRWFLAWLLASATCAQALGSLHGVAHAMPGSALMAIHPDTAAWPPDPRQGLIESLFALHDDAPDCRILDGLCQHGPAAALHAIAPLPVPESLVRRLQHGAFVARWAALFDARGPPHAPRAFS